MKRGEEFPLVVLARQALERALPHFGRRPLEALADVGIAHDHLEKITWELDRDWEVEVDEYCGTYERLAQNLAAGITLYVDDPRALGFAAGLVLCEIEQTFRSLSRMAHQEV